MANKSNKKADLKIKTLEQQLENKDKRIQNLQSLRKNNTIRNPNKQYEPDISDNFFLDIFSFFKLG